MRHVDCPRQAVVVEEVPRGDGKHQWTNVYMLFLARWARFSWKVIVGAGVVKEGGAAHSAVELKIGRHDFALRADTPYRAWE